MGGHIGGCHDGETGLAKELELELYSNEQTSHESGRVENLVGSHSTAWDCERRCEDDPPMERLLEHRPA